MEETQGSNLDLDLAPNFIPVHCITPFCSDALVSSPNLFPPCLSNFCIPMSTSYPGSSLFLPRESTLVSAGHVSPLSKQRPTRVDSLSFKKRREKRMQIFSNWHEDRGMEVISSLFFIDRDAEKIYSLLSAAFQKHK